MTPDPAQYMVELRLMLTKASGQMAMKDWTALGTSAAELSRLADELCWACEAKNREDDKRNAARPS